MSGDALFGDDGSREQREERRVLVNPGTKAQWVVGVPSGTRDQAELVASEFVVATRIQRRTVTTYTTDWADEA